jgi:endonuclease/exonuclease/phosphatase family metal-dependent hydrolase
MPGFKHTGNVIYNIGAHLVALQEVDFFMPRSYFSRQARRLGRMLGMHYIFGANMKWPGGCRYGNAILSRFPFAGWQNIPLPGAGEKRGLLKTLIRLPGGNVQFYFLCTHLGLSSAERLEQINKIMSITSALPEPFILAGDFNAGQNAAEFLPLLEKMQNTGDFAAGQYVTFPSYRPGYGLDYIFVSRHWQVKSCHILASDASDHLPVLVELELP